MQSPSPTAPLRILVVDDNESIHRDIRKILCPAGLPQDILEAEAELFGQSDATKPQPRSSFLIESALQGQEGLEMLKQALSESRPYAMAFVDVRMPPGWDGIETIRHLWNSAPDLQVVICSAFSDHSWDDIVRNLGYSDNFVILKKPFDNIEVLQLAHALTKKWIVTRQANLRMVELDAMVSSKTAELTAANLHLKDEVRRRERTELELRASEHRFEMAFQAGVVPMAVMHAPSQTFLEANESFTRLVDQPREQILGKTLPEICRGVRAQDVEQALEVVRRTGRLRDYAMCVQPNGGDPRETLISLEPVVLGEEPCLLAAVLDVTEQRKLESQLRQSQKMDAIGQLAAGIAHDFNNLLTIIHGHASLQLARVKPDDALAQSLTHVRMAADRAATLTRQLLAFSRKQVMQRRVISLNGTVERLRGMLERMLGETIRLECACAPALPHILADEGSIDQVIVNLVVNARDAMRQGGILALETRAVTIDSNNLACHPEARLGRFVCLTVADTGEGIDPIILNRIFEPFFTTKPPGKGTGLGLSTVYGIVKQHEGWVEVESVPGLGTKFHVYLGATNSPIETAQDNVLVQIEPALTSRKRTVLVVEDEPELREFVKSILEGHGYSVLHAADGVDALEIFRQAKVRIDLLLTDMIMPGGISGNNLASQMLKSQPDLRILFTSGYSEELLENADRLVLGGNFLPKPFDVAKLLRAVQQCLEPEPCAGTPDHRAVRVN
jgi:PAS domain S-box-containing protein